MIATEFVNFVDRTLARVCDAELSDDGKNWFGAMIGEILDNAETHSAPEADGGYSIAGFIAKRRVGRKEVFRFHLGFLSLGQTIAESLANAPDPIRPSIDSYVNRHRSNRWTDEALRTVVALQDGVSRLEEKYDVVNGRSLGGTGLADVLQFHRWLNLLAAADDEPKLAIISGSTYILAKEPYRVAQPQPGQRARELWFNQGNTRDAPPDQNHVFGLPGFLQGTLVTMAFNINPDLLGPHHEPKS